MKLNLLAIGVHPDDVELGCGGTILSHLQLGHKVGIVDLTQGELGSRGSGQIRLKEAEVAGNVLCIHARENLGLADGFFENNKDSQLTVIRTIRKYQPDIILCNAPNDRHPDHGRASKLVVDAAFLSGLSRIETLDDTGKPQQHWRPKVVYHYIQALFIKPDLVVDITGHMDKKMESVLAYRSQFYDPNSNEPDTFISSPEFLDMVKSRAIEFGTIIGAQYGEGFVANRYVGVKDLTQLM
jgi:bacillithiol biosynthesis deacetylase BshB1